MDANQVLAVIKSVAPQLEPTLDPNEPEFMVLLNDGVAIDTHDLEDQEWAIMDATGLFDREGIKTEDEMRKVIADYVNHVKNA